jgi:hypothetical protein
VERLLRAMIAWSEQAEQAARLIARELVRLRTLSEQGNFLSLASTLDSLSASTGELGQLMRAMDSSFPSDLTEYLNPDLYLEELRSAAAAAGLMIFAEEDGQVLCPPSVIRMLPDKAALDIDGQREHRLRPSVVVEVLADRQRKPRFHATAFLNSIREAYDLVVSRNGNREEGVVRLVDIWHVLTLLPGREKEYSRNEFTRDLYLLDDADVTSTLKSDRQLRWCASSGTRSQGVLSTVGADGRQRHYWGVYFVKSTATGQVGRDSVAGSVVDPVNTAVTVPVGDPVATQQRT